MSYRVIYHEDATQEPSKRWPTLTGLFFLAFLFWVMTSWPEGRSVILELLMPGAENAGLAAEVFLQEAEEGRPFWDSLEAMIRTLFVFSPQ